MMQKTRRSLAKALGRSERTVRRWLEREDWPFGTAGPWDTAKVKAWADKSLSPDPATDSTTATASEKQEKLRLIIERRRKLRLERLALEGAYVLKSEVEAGRIARIEEVKSRLLGLQRIAPQLVGMAEGEIAKVLEAEAIKICNRFAREPN